MEAKFLQTPWAKLSVDLLTMSASLQGLGSRTAMSVTQGQLSPQFLHMLFQYGASTSKVRHGIMSKHMNLELLAKDLEVAAATIRELHKRSIADAVNQTVSQILSQMDIVLPETRFCLNTIPRGTFVVISGAPKKAYKQLLENLPDGEAGPVVALLTKKGTKQLDAFATTLSRATNHPDLVVVEDLDEMRELDSEPTMLPSAKFNAVTRTLRRIANDYPQTAVLAFSGELDTGEIERLRLLDKTRVVVWTDDFGPDAFFGIEEARARYAKQIADAHESLKDAQERLEAEAAKDEQPDDSATGQSVGDPEASVSPSAEEPAHESTIIMP